MCTDRNSSKTQPYPPIETVEVIKSIKSKEKDLGWFRNWLEKDEEMRKRRSGISRSANESIDKIENPDNIECSLTITMKLSEWKSLHTQLGTAYPSWKLENIIYELITRMGTHLNADDNVVK